MISEQVLNSRIPRLGTITVGRGVEATSKRGSTYARPTKANTLVFHTNDAEVANAVQVMFGGDLLRDSPTWDYDVVTDTRTVEVLLLAGGFRQALELWRAGECVRRCDGVIMQTHNGRPTNEACLCQPEIDRGQERACTPTTVVPVLIELDVERLGVWEIRSNAWGTASAMAGTMKALAMVGAANRSVPAIVAMVDRTTRDNTGQVREVVELHATIARSHHQLAALAGQAVALDAPAVAELGEGDGGRLDLMTRWSELQARAHGLGLREQLVADWKAMFGAGHTEFDTLTAEELAGWVDMVAATVADAEAAIRQEQAEAAQEAAERARGTTTPAEGPAAHSGAQGAASGDDRPPPPDQPAP